MYVNWDDFCICNWQLYVVIKAFVFIEMSVNYLFQLSTLLEVC